MLRLAVISIHRALLPAEQSNLPPQHIVRLLLLSSAIPIRVDRPRIPIPHLTAKAFIR